ncbi:MAG TPA: hypothetical protein VMG08_10545 [Allosphingosinicella sp.]|nr:hypothetical protein [Allosphingosinicella sp.]
MRAWLKLALTALLAGAAAGVSAAPAQSPGTPPPSVAATVVRDGGSWTAEFRFAQRSPAWMFSHSSVTRDGNRAWRPESWTVLTPGVRLARHGRHDVLFAERGNVPAVVRVRFTPVSSDLVAEYDPALIFTDGSVALWSGHFHLMPVASTAAVAALPVDLNGLSFGGNGSQVTFRDRGGQVLHIGRRFDSATLIGGKLYVLFGPLRPVVSPDIATVIDPALPDWLKRELAASTPAILAHFTQVLGPHRGAFPTLLVSWRGPTPRLSSMGGSTLQGQIGMTFEGVGVVAENQELRHGARWFIAHEAAHFWLGNAVRYESQGDSWIMEGGADMLAARAIAAMDPAYDPRPKLQNSVNECAGFAHRPIATAGERGDNQAFYACGAVFALIAEGVSRRPYGAFIRPVIDANRADGVLTAAEWLAALAGAGADPGIVRDIQAMLRSGVSDPKAMLASLFTRAGVRFTPGADGVPRLQ